MEFSTFDKDNDECSCNCAGDSWGGNWWEDCGRNSINGKYVGSGSRIYGSGIWWYHFNNDHMMSLKTMTLMFRQTV